MTYDKINWQPGEAGNTLVTAQRLNHMDTQYDAATADLTTFAVATNTALAGIQRGANMYRGTGVQREAEVSALSGSLWQDTDGTMGLYRWTGSSWAQVQTKGDPGDDGLPGADGPANVLSVGTVSTGAAGSNANVTITGTTPAQTVNFTIPRGDKGDPGEPGADGTSVTIIGSLPSVDDLPASGTAGDAYMIDGDLYVWSPTLNDWQNVGPIQGPKGDKGDPGDPGANGDPGPANTLTVGTVVTGETAAANITGISPNQTLDLTLPRGTTGPIGSGMMWFTATPPSGWLWLDGSTFSQSTYPDLFAVLGTNTLPDLSDKVPVGFKSGVNTLGALQGSNSITLSTAQIPAHKHNVSLATAGAHTHTGTAASAGAHTHTGTAASAGVHTHVASAASAGEHDHGGVTSTVQISGSANNTDTASMPATNAVMRVAPSANAQIRNWANGLHEHTITADGAHTHTVTVNEDGAHTHSVTTVSAGAHTHSVTTVSAGDHTHAVTEDTVGSGASVDVRQAGIVVGWIIRAA